ncbi:MAG: hypothetical protein PGN37_20755 [Mycobacterium kyogaense]
MGDAVAGVDTRDELAEHAEESMVSQARWSFVEHVSILRRRHS